MIECKHGMKSGCVYCHVVHTPAPVPVPPAAAKRRPRSPLSEKMNDRMTTLQRRLKAIRGD
jgi:hypothetical protein